MLLNSLLKSVSESKPVPIPLAGSSVSEIPFEVTEPTSVAAAELPIQEPEVEILFLCPFCFSNHLKDDSQGLRCDKCLKLAWYWQENSLIRSDCDPKDYRLPSEFPSKIN